MNPPKIEYDKEKYELWAYLNVEGKVCYELVKKKRLFNKPFSCCWRVD